jgi:hypothetical protein
MTRLKASVILRLVNFGRTRPHATPACIARRENERGVSPMGTRELLLILHRCRELGIADRPKQLAAVSFRQEFGRDE